MIYFRDALKFIEQEYADQFEVIKTILIKDVESNSPKVKLENGRIGFIDEAALRTYVAGLGLKAPKPKVKFKDITEALIFISKKHNRSLAGFVFVYETCEAAFKHCKPPINAQTLMTFMRDVSVDTFGLLAKHTLVEIGIGSTQDFGVLLFILIEEGIFRAEDNDKLADFKDVFNFEDLTTLAKAKLETINL